MKTLLQRLALALFATLVSLAWSADKPAVDGVRISTGATPESGRIVLDLHGVVRPTPVFFSAVVGQTVRLSAAEITGDLRLRLRVVQGHAKVLSLGLVGEGEVLRVTGAELRDWAVRQDAEGRRFLDLRVAADDAPDRGPAAPLDYDFAVVTRRAKPSVPGKLAVLIVTPGDAVGFSSALTLQPDATLDARVVTATGFTPLQEGAGAAALQFVSSGDSRLEVSLTARGAALVDAELLGVQLTGRVNEAMRSVEFRLRGQLRIHKAGARLRLLSGRAALSDKPGAAGWHVEVAAQGDHFAYDLVGEREGTLPLDLVFVASIQESGDWRTLDFSMPAGAVVPLQLEGLDQEVTFQSTAAVVPIHTAQGWQGFLPANGAATLAWKRTRDAAEGTLFFTTTELNEVRIGAGLLRQAAQIGFRILQGKLSTVRCRIEGPGEIVGVEGANVVGWKVLPVEAGGRVLEVRLSRPMETEGALTVQSQAELGAWPVRAEPIRLIPEGGLRHSGYVRIANRGAVRLEVTEVSGLMQLAPTQFPGAAAEAGARQLFVHRFPSSNYGYRVLATQIQPEVSLSTVTTYELGETARVINAALELDVREAPLRDWTLRVPADYTVVSVAGAEVADHVAESEATGGYRTLRVLFTRGIEGRQLLQLRLERNQPAAAGDWTLPPLQFPHAKTVRGHVGAVSTPGYRLVPARTDKLVEVPLSFFPRQTAGLQQAWRLREGEWTAELRVEAMGQSIQADVFHLYSLKEGVVTSSVLLNYFVVGAPANEWRVEVPASVGNIDVVGQNVRRDWRRDGDQIVVTLHQPVLGAATLLITFEQPMSARGGTIVPGQVRPIGVQAERGFIQIVSPLQVKHEIRRAEGVLKLEPAELPAEFRVFTSSPSLAVYQYTGRPFAFELGVEWYAPGDTVDQIVDFAKLSSQVSRDGQVVTEVQFFVKTRGRKPLRLTLPAGVKLWEARVDNEVVNARADGEHTLIPLPARLNPNDPVTVALRLGQAAVGSGTSVSLSAPRVDAAPTVINEWVVRSDAGRVLVPKHTDAALTRPTLAETGFEWVSHRAVGATFLMLTFMGLGSLALRTATGWRVVAGLVLLALGAGLAMLLAISALTHYRPNQHELTLAATIIPAGQPVTLQFANLPAWRAMLVGWGLATAIVGAVVLVVARLRRPDASAPTNAIVFHHLGMIVGLLLVALGLLAQRGGAVAFYVAASAAVFVRIVVPGVLLWRRERRDRAVEPGAGPAGAVTLVALGALTLFGLGGTSEAQAAAAPKRAATPPAASALDAARPGSDAALLPDGTRAAEALVETWAIRKDRLFAEAELTIRGRAGDSFVLLRSPAVLTEFRGEGLRIGKVERNGQYTYHATPERNGVFTAHVRYELPVPDRTKPIALPTGAAAAHRVTVELDQAGWEFVSPMAVQTLPTDGAKDNRSGATLVLALHPAPIIQLQARRRDLTTEVTQFYTETANLYLPGPGVVNGLSRISVRPVQGRVSALEIEVPAGFTVGDVSRGPVGAWRFDPVKRRLHVSVEPAQGGAFKFDVETQLGAGELPFALTLAPVRVAGSAGDVGLLGLAFGGDAQPEGVRPEALSVVNVQDFDGTLLPRTREGHALATLQHVWRYGNTGGRVELKIAPVAAEVRATSRQVLSLDDDRMVMSIDLRVVITRVGLFKLSFALPEGLEVEALSGPALSHWTEAAADGQRLVTLHLNGRTLGEQTFNLTLAGSAPRTQAAWPYPRFALREATRQTGEALIVPGKGIRLRAAARERVTQLDPRAVGGQQPGTLAFRLLQEDWVLQLGIEMLDAWVTAQALQEVTLRDGQTLTRLAVRYRVENAAVKQVRVRLPGLSDEVARTVRATGAAVSDIVRVADTPDTWEIRFQRGIAGETDVQIEFQAPAARERSAEPVNTPEFIGARQATHFVAMRSAGRLEMEAGPLPRGWSRVDWSAVPAVLQNRSDRSMPSLCFRVAEPEGALAVNVRRHDVAGALKLRVTQGDLMTLFSPAGATITAVDLKVEVIEKSTLRVRLPAGARLFNTFVNGESVAVVRDGDAWLFYVTPHASGNRSGTVRLVYAAKAGGRGELALLGPSLSVPLENVNWRVVIPPGYELEDYAGGLRLREDRFGSLFGIEQYKSTVSSKRSAEAKQGMTLLQQASSWMQQGDQEKAGAALSQAFNNRSLDSAANEDARVQLRNLKTQQAVLGLNTRRQRLVLENGTLAPLDQQVEQAATINPLMSGNFNFDPRQTDQLLRGNTAEENTALRGIAARIVDQQLGAEPAPGAIDVTLPERGRVLTFARSLQVDGSAPLELKLEVGKITDVDARVIVLVLLSIAGIAAIELARARANGTA